MEGSRDIGSAIHVLTPRVEKKQFIGCNLAACRLFCTVMYNRAIWARPCNCRERHLDETVLRSPVRLQNVCDLVVGVAKYESGSKL